jgi:hypothetical protein
MIRLDDKIIDCYGRKPNGPKQFIIRNLPKIPLDTAMQVSIRNESYHILEIQWGKNHRVGILAQRTNVAS